MMTVTVELLLQIFLEGWNRIVGAICGKLLQPSTIPPGFMASGSSKT